MVFAVHKYVVKGSVFSLKYVQLEMLLNMKVRSTRSHQKKKLSLKLKRKEAFA